MVRINIIAEHASLYSLPEQVLHDITAPIQFDLPSIPIDQNRVFLDLGTRMGSCDNRGRDWPYSNTNQNARSLFWNIWILVCD